MTREEFLKKWSGVVYEPEPTCSNRFALGPDLNALLVAEAEALMKQRDTAYEKLNVALLQNGELKKAARALLDKLHRSWVGKDYAEYAFSENATSHPMVDLEKLLTEKQNGAPPVCGIQYPFSEGYHSYCGRQLGHEGPHGHNS